MTQYGVAALVKGITINCRLRLVLGHLWASDMCTLYVTPHYYAALALGLLHSHRILQEMIRIRTMRNRLTLPLLLLMFTMALPGCGQKGPLYLPDKPEQPAESEDSELPDT